ncbi:hypothetical protein SLS59_007312 [Nothophoma quercina]|uniref:Pectate lyase n=1 Tax=Nothophoma quercina TaxID=749835 RepID=A0ABR3QZM5_9PLEO
MDHLDKSLSSGSTNVGDYKKRAPPPKLPAKAPAKPATPATIKTKNYEIVEKVAKGQKLVVGESYLMTARTGVHKQIVVGKVVETTDKKTGQKTLDIDAAMSELTKDVGNGSTFSKVCKMFYGGTCEENHVQNYSCVRGANGGTSYKFVSTANVVFADKSTFVQNGEVILQKNTKYNILTNNCWTHAKKLANVTKQ